MTRRPNRPTSAAAGGPARPGRGQRGRAGPWCAPPISGRLRAGPRRGGSRSRLASLEIDDAHDRSVSLADRARAGVARAPDNAARAKPSENRTPATQELRLMTTETPRPAEPSCGPVLAAALDLAA